MLKNTPDAHRFRAASLLFGALAFLALLALIGLVYQYRHITRGIGGTTPQSIPAGGSSLGLNVALEQYSESELLENVRAIRSSGITSVKQTFFFMDPFDWAAAERIVNTAAEAGLSITVQLDGNPATSFAPPDQAAFEAWVREFGLRFGDIVDSYMIWDEPNLASHWGNQPVNPGEYAALLSAASRALRQVDPGALIVAAPLAPTTETGPDNLNERDYLRSLLGAGAAASVDAFAAKPYGFDTGPDDRRVEQQRLNFSRVILMREELVRQGFGDKAVWAGNWGWNVLPAGWTGAPSVWGQTSDEQRARWSVAALERARREWPWMGPMFLENWNSAALADDPRQGFAVAGTGTASALAAYQATLDESRAEPGFHPATAADPAQTYSQGWEFDPALGADIGGSGDWVTVEFWGTDIAVVVRRADYRARFYVSVDGQAPNSLPEDENGAMLILTAPVPGDDLVSVETIASNLSPGPHRLEMIASGGWDQWALKGFSVGYRPDARPYVVTGIGLALISLLCIVGMWQSARKARLPETSDELAVRYNALSDRAQLLIVALTAGLVGLTGWMTWGQELAGAYRRLGDPGQIAATAAAATIFYITPTFFVYVVALAILFVLLVLRPAWGVALIAFSIPFYVAPLPKEILGYRFSAVEIFTLVTFGAWLMRSMLDAALEARRGRLRLRWPQFERSDYAVFAFVLVATISLAFTERLNVATNEWRVVILEPALFYLLLRATRLKSSELWVVLDAFVLSAIVIAGYGLWQYVTGQNIITAEAGLMRLRSIFGSPNNVALYLGRVLPLLVAMLLLGDAPSNHRRRWLYGLAILPIGAAILLTFSRGALLLGIPVSMLVVFWLWQRANHRRTWPWAVAGLGLGAVSLAAAAQTPQLAGRFNLMGATGFLRLNLWRSTVNMIADHPLFGVGLDNFLYAYRGRYILDAAWQEPNLNHPHNIVLDVTSRLGLFGLLTFGWMVVAAARLLWQAINSVHHTWLPVAVGFAGSLAAMVAHGMVDHSFFLIDLAYVFYLTLGVAVWMARPMPQEDAGSPSRNAGPTSA